MHYVTTQIYARYYYTVRITHMQKTFYQMGKNWYFMAENLARVFHHQ